jgi:hypothetical protein
MDMNDSFAHFRKILEVSKRERGQDTDTDTDTGTVVFLVVTESGSLFLTHLGKLFLEDA